MDNPIESRAEWPLAAYAPTLIASINKTATNRSNDADSPFKRCELVSLQGEIVCRIVAIHGTAIIRLQQSQRWCYCTRTKSMPGMHGNDMR